jgi:hypothetical protein
MCLSARLVAVIFSSKTLKGNSLYLFLFMNVIQHSFICRPSDSTVSEDVGIERKNLYCTWKLFILCNFDKLCFVEALGTFAAYLHISKTISCHEDNVKARKHVKTSFIFMNMYLQRYSIFALLSLSGLYDSREKRARSLFDTRLVTDCCLTEYTSFLHSLSHSLSSLQISNLQHRPTTIYFSIK